MKIYRMKRRQLLLFISSLLLLLSCGGGDDGGGGTPAGGSEYLNVSDINIPKGNTTATLYVQASQNCEWEITSGESWVNFNPQKGRGTQNVTVTVTQNPSSTEARMAIAQIKGTGIDQPREVKITQQPSSESLELNTSTLTFESAGGSQEVVITSNTHWTIAGVANWFTLSVDAGDNDGKVVVNVSTNISKNEREAKLTIMGQGGTSKQLTVKQLGDTSTDFHVSPTELSAEALATTLYFNIVGDAQWTVYSNAGWAIPATLNGEGNANVTVSLTDNTNEQPREALITVSSQTKSETVVVKQAAGTLPEVSNAQASNIGKSSATVSFTYSSLFPVTEYGICYSTTDNPTIDNNRQSETDSANSGSASLSLSDLQPGTTYFIRPYARSAVGIRYGNSLSFTTTNDWPGGDDNLTPEF